MTENKKEKISNMRSPSQVHVTLAIASTTAENAVGANAHAAAVRIRLVHGFLVYVTLVVDSNNNFHGVLVDAGND